jgi:hypothetical protein
MVLNVADSDDLKFEFVNMKLMETRRRLEVNEAHLQGNFPFDMGQVLEGIFFRKWGGASGLAVAFPADEVLSGGLQVEVGVVECMIGSEPEPILVLW